MQPEGGSRYANMSRTSSARWPETALFPTILVGNRNSVYRNTQKGPCRLELAVPLEGNMYSGLAIGFDCHVIALYDFLQRLALDAADLRREAHVAFCMSQQTIQVINSEVFNSMLF